MKPRCYFVADLHLFAERSLAEEHWPAILRCARGAGHLVLGGDIFDFRWARNPCEKTLIENAAHRLRRLAETNHNCQIHYVLGNHDHHLRFLDRLDRLTRETPNFAWYPYQVRIGEGLFLHGDVADRQMTAQTLAQRRERWTKRHKPKREISHRLYDAVIKTGVHRAVPKILYPKRVVARRIFDYLDDIGEGPEGGVRNVYFGHTHVVMQGYHYRGIRFFNGGAPIKGLPFDILEADI